MTSMELRSIVVKKYRHYSSKTNILDRENILNQDFKSSTINEKWCTDITYIHTIKDGWTYLASVMDIYNKNIIGYAYGKSMTAELALKAVLGAA
ncbi:DDE-type integrase/transposase/recombinase [Lutibacter sp. B2]|nr:DDE-type integrase/transposase/recombinase [Lutibacter sp. B2]